MIRFYLYVISFLVFISGNLVAQESNLQTNVNVIANKHIEKKNNRALIIGYFNNGVPTIKYYGETEKGNGTLPNKNSVFQIGAATKVFTATLLAQFEQKQYLNTDDDIKKYFPKDVVLPFYQKVICKPDNNAIRIMDDPDFDNAKFSPYLCIPDPKSVPPDVRLCYLASHTSGFPLNPSNLKQGAQKSDPYRHYTKELLYDYIKNYKLIHSFGTEYKYSSTGFAILGHALELNRNESLDQLFDKYIFAELGMTNSGLSSDNSTNLKLVSGHKKSGKRVTPYHYKVMASALGMHSTISDLMLFLEANMQLKPSALNDAMQLAQKPRVRINKKGLKNSQIALGWYITPFNGEKIIWHSGNTAGYSTFIGFIDGTKNGVVILANNDSKITPMAKEVLNLLK